MSSTSTGKGRGAGGPSPRSITNELIELFCGAQDLASHQLSITDRTKLTAYLRGFV